MRLKEFVKTHKVIVIILIMLIVFSALIIFFKNREENKTYTSPEIENIPYDKKQYAKNEYRVINMQEEDVYELYYHDFLNKMLNDKEAAWNILDSETKAEQFNDRYDNYETYLKNNITKNTHNNKVLKYQVTEMGTQRKISVVDSEGYVYTFNENGVFNYNVHIDGKTKID